MNNREGRLKTSLFCFYQKMMNSNKKHKDNLENILNISSKFLAINTVSELFESLDLQEEILKVEFLEYFQFYNDKGRLIQVPNPTLMNVQKKISKYLNSIYYLYFNEVKIQNYTYQIDSINKRPRKKNNHKEALKIHLENDHFTIIDIKDFFESVNQVQIQTVFRNHPFYFSEDVITELLKLVLFDNSLPNGAPCSPILSNFSLIEADRYFSSLKIRYSRFADDLLFSSIDIDRSVHNKLMEEVLLYLNNLGFKTNYSKFRTTNKNRRQFALGLKINQKINLRREYIRNIRAILHFQELNSIEKSAEKYYKINLIKYIKSQHSYFLYEYGIYYPLNYFKHNCNKYRIEKFYCHSLAGKIKYVGWVRGSNDPVYNSLLIKFNLLNPNYSANKETINSTPPDWVYITNATAKNIANSVYREIEAHTWNTSNSFGFQKTNFENIFHGIISNDSETLKKIVSLKKIKNSDNSDGSSNNILSRRIFHSSSSCELLNSDFVENSKVVPNSGVLKAGLKTKDFKFVCLEKGFLESLGMRGCSKCTNDTSGRISIKDLWPE